eukprot:1859522-Rhodomonas_salina.3
MAAVSTPLFAAFVSLGLIVPTAFFFWVHPHSPFVAASFQFSLQALGCSWKGYNLTRSGARQLRIDEPYMDEIFHIPQAQRYCRHVFIPWVPHSESRARKVLVVHTTCALRLPRGWGVALAAVPCTRNLFALDMFSHMVSAVVRQWGL